MYDLAMFALHVAQSFWVDVGEAERFPNMLVQQIHHMSSAAPGELDRALVERLLSG